MSAASFLCALRFPLSIRLSFNLNDRQAGGWWWVVAGDSHKLTPAADGVRAWSFNLQALDDRLDSSDTTEPVTSLVPRFDLHVQSVRPAASTWTRRCGRRRAGGATASSRFVRPAIAATPIVRGRAAPPPGKTPSAPRAAAIERARKAASTIAITSARIALA
jgi:hypothetical protein